MEVGTKLHEDTIIPNVGIKVKVPTLRKGMCLAIEPMVNRRGSSILLCLKMAGP